MQAAAERIGGLDGHVGEAGAAQLGVVVGDGDGSTEAVDRRSGVAVVAVVDDVADPDAATGSKDSGDFGEHGVLVGGQHDDAVGDDDIDGGVPERHVVDGAVEELDVADACVGGVAASQFDHLGRGVEAVDEAAGSDAASRQQHVEAAARAEVEHGVALVEVGDRRRIATPEADPYGGGGHAIELVVVAGPERRTIDGAHAAAVAGSAGGCGVSGERRVALFGGHQHTPSAAQTGTPSSHGTVSGRRPMISSAADGKQSRQRSLIRHQLELPTRSTSTKQVSPRIWR